MLYFERIKIMVNIKIKKLHKDARIPIYATDGSAAVDIYAIEDYVIKASDGVRWIRTGIAIEMPKGYYAGMYNRSGLAAKKELIIVSSKVIDNDYRGEITVPMKLIARLPESWGLAIKKGDRIAQMIVRKYEKVEFEEVDELTKTERGSGGFSSTGK
jgi:dUTP pyrophosphatase